jgi:hypothetical protein
MDKELFTPSNCARDEEASVAQRPKVLKRSAWLWSEFLFGYVAVPVLMYEHILPFGDLIFTVGIGQFFYHLARC